MNIGGNSWECCRASCWWSRSTGTGTTGLIKISRKRSQLVTLAMSDYVVSGMHDKLGTLRVSTSDAS